MTSLNRKTVLIIAIAAVIAVAAVGAAAYFILNPLGKAGDASVVFVSQRDYPEASADGKSSIYIMNSDGTGARRLTENSVPNISPAWSADGKIIAFVMDENVYRMNKDGLERQKLAVRGSFPEWSPDGRHIIFTVQTTMKNYELFIMDADGANKKRLAQGHVTQFKWSPDGKSIAYTQGRSGTGATSLLHIINPDTLADTALPAPAGGDANSPSWSPDGKRIAFSSFFGETRGDLYVIDVASKDLKKIEMPDTLGVWHYLPVWSADGHRIAFLTSADPPWSRKTAPTDIAVTQQDGTAAKRVTHLKNREFASDIKWAGGSLLFTFGKITVKDKKNETSTDVYLVSLDGKMKRLTKTGRDSGADWKTSN